MHVNQRLAEARSVITVNSIEPHYFAGYTGGRKGFLPGIAGLRHDRRRTTTWSPAPVRPRSASRATRCTRTWRRC